MINRRTAAVLLGSAALGLMAAAGPASAHPDRAPQTKDGKAAPAAGKARAHRAQVRAYRRALRNCSLSPKELLSEEDNAFLAKVKQRLAQRVEDEEISKERAAARFALIQKRTTIRVTRNAARRAPVFALFGVADAKAFREAVKAARGMRKLMNKEDVTRAAFRQAHRDGLKSARDAVIAICAEDEPTTETSASS